MSLSMKVRTTSHLGMEQTIDCIVQIQKTGCSVGGKRRQVTYNDLSLSGRTFISKMSCVSIPQCIQEALGNPKWKEAMQKEMKAFYKNNKWDLVKLPGGRKGDRIQMSV